MSPRVHRVTLRRKPTWKNRRCLKIDNYVMRFNITCNPDLFISRFPGWEVEALEAGPLED